MVPPVSRPAARSALAPLPYWKYRALARRDISNISCMSMPVVLERAVVTRER
jgi:hypothetical protein